MLHLSYFFGTDNVQTWKNIYKLDTYEHHDRG